MTLNRDSMDTETAHWYPEERLERLDRCRRFLYGEQVITRTVNDAIRTSLEEARDSVLIASQDDLIPSAFATDPDDEEPDDEEPDDE